jgi:hypothetical protein
MRYREQNIGEYKLTSISLYFETKKNFKWIPAVAKLFAFSILANNISSIFLK